MTIRVVSRIRKGPTITQICCMKPSSRERKQKYITLSRRTLTLCDIFLVYLINDYSDRIGTGTRIGHAHIGLQFF